MELAVLYQPLLFFRDISRLSVGEMNLKLNPYVSFMCVTL